MMTDPLPSTPAHTNWLDLPPEQAQQRRDEYVRIGAAICNEIAQIERALAACRQFPDAPTAGDALRLATLMSVTRYTA